MIRLGVAPGTLSCLALLSAALTTPPGVAQQVDAVEPNRGGTMTLEARDPEVAVSRLHPAAGYEVSLFASEQDFPIGNPVSLAFDSQGRLWVATMPTYPQRLPDQQPDDKLIILEDRDHDGRADHHTVWAQGLHLPTGFELGDGGAYVAQQPNLMFLADTDGDDRAEKSHVVLHGFGTEDSHHSISAFVWGPGGGLYFQEGTFHHSQVETPHGPVRLVDAGVFRYEPRRFWLEVFVSYPFANPWGHVFDRWGQSFLADASGGANYFGTAISGNAIYPEKRSRMKVFTSIVRPTSGCEIVSSRHFPDEAQGNFLINNTIGFQGIKQHRMIEAGSGFTSEEVEPLLYSTDINFRPVDLEFGPDGALYVVDWFNPLVGHMQYSLRDPRRDHGHGRIWRITYKGRPLLDPPRIAGASVGELVELLGAYEDRTRYRVRRELRSLDVEEVVRELGRWLERSEHDDSLSTEEREHRYLEALWVHQSLHRFDRGLLERVLASAEPRARAAATRVLRFWRHEIPDALELLRRKVHDPFARTRLEALLGLSYLPSEDAVRSALEVVEHPTDYYLDYVLGETVRTLRPWWRPDLANGELLTALPESGALYLLAQLETDELAELAELAQLLPSSPQPQRLLVHSAMARRSDAGPERLRRALVELAAARGVSLAEEIVLAIENESESGQGAVRGELVGTLGDLLVSVAAVEPHALAALGDRLRPLASARSAAVREASLAALLAAPQAATGTGAHSAADHTAPDHASPEQTVDWLRALRRTTAEARERSADTVFELAAEGGELQGEALLTLATLPVRRADSLSLLVELSADRDLAGEVFAALRRFAAAGWPPASRSTLQQLAERITAHLEAVPLERLTEESVAETFALGYDLADLIAERPGRDLRRQLLNLGPVRLTLRAVPHEMVYDRRELVVRAGRPVQLVFENPDVAPHNVVITEPAALVEVGRLADALAAADPIDALVRDYLPESELILFSTPLVQPGERAELVFVAPAEPGRYPFLCTFPGHWILMNGVLRVVDELAEPTPTSITTVTDATSVREFVREWTLDDLRADVERLGADAGDLAHGERLFRELGCEKCHRHSLLSDSHLGDGDGGGEIGPALDESASKYEPLELLRHLLEPSAAVEERYQTWLVETDDGGFYSGQLVGEDADVVQLLANPLEPDEITVLPRVRITTLERTPLSPMPSGLLTTLEREEVLQLLRFLRAPTEVRER